MIPLLLYSCGYLLLFCFGEWLLRIRQWKPESTRTLIHIITGLISFTFPTGLDHFWQVALLCCSFMIVLWINERVQVFKSISGVERKSCGSWLYAVAVLTCFYVFEYKSDLLYYFIPLSVLAVSDPLASIVGSRYPLKVIWVFNHKKSLGGSTAFFLSSLVVCSMAAYIGYISFNVALVIAMISTIVELMTVRGWDNITVPFSIMLILNFVL